MTRTQPTIFTIGFTNKSAERFFSLLNDNKVRRLIDTRINNTSQLSGFAKGKDLAFFCRAIGGIEYVHRVDMAPTEDLLADYRKGRVDWEEYTDVYLKLLHSRKVADNVTPADLTDSCLLCSEHLPDQCHRRLLAEYLREHFPQITISHLI